MTASARRFACVLVLVCPGLLTAAVRAQSVDPRFWGTDGIVEAIACSGNTIYIGGSFTTVAPCTGGGVPLLAATGGPIRGFPRVAGAVNAAVSDGEGGWYIGGDFDAVEGIGHIGLAHVLADGRVAPWAPPLQSADNIFALALAGHTLYVGGGFHKSAGPTSTPLAAVDTRTGAFLPWDPRIASWVFCLAVEDSTVYVGGDVYTAGGQRRSGMAAVDARTAAVRPWNPGANDAVNAIVVRGNTVYVAGDFTYVGGQPRNHLAALDAQSGGVLAWDPKADGTVGALALERRALLAGGQFTNVGGSPRHCVAALDPVTGVATPWVPSVDLFDVYSLATSNDEPYAGGVIARADGTHEYAVVSLPVSAHAGHRWATPTNRPAYVLAADRDRLFAGGEFSSVGRSVGRANLAALDARSGEVTAWDPRADAVVEALASERGTVWVGGGFTRIGGRIRSHLAALDGATGRALALDPGANGDVHALASNGRLVFAGGGFDTVAGLPRRNLAAFDAFTGRIARWDPGADGAVATMAVRPNAVFVGGSFAHVGVDGPAPQPRYELAALDAGTGAPIPWTPEVSGGFGLTGGVKCLALSDTAVYVAGDFARVDGQDRAGLAAVNAVSGAVTSWNPGPYYVAGPSYSYALAVDGPHVYVSGLFDFLGGGRRIRVGVVDATTGKAVDWDPHAGYDVQAFAVCGNKVYAGGDLWAIGGYPVNGFAAIFDPVRPVRRARAVDVAGAGVPTSMVLAQSDPNPARGGTSIRFALPTAAPVTLTVYDLQGRCIASLLDREPQSAGVHDVRLSTSSWPAGCYLYRLQAGGEVVTRKMVVLR